jgi:AAA+ ATPase superfamily predicted ATPase
MFAIYVLADYSRNVIGQNINYSGVILDTIIGRNDEKKKLAKILHSGEAEFLAIYGRRRVGKTFTIREFFKNKGLYFEVTGQKDATFNEQLDNFHKTLHEIFKPDLPIQKPESWKEAFSFLTILVKLQPPKKNIIIFLDELPWLATKRSGLLQALDYEWNSVWSRTNNLKLIVCGSAASWILEKLIHAKGGLYNRITNTIHLKPFSIGESKLYLEKKGINLTPVQILELYMVMGGIPFYLRQVEKGKSSAQIINSLCFQKDGFLFSEFNRLFKSLFDQSEIHYKIIREIAKKRNGILREELLKSTGRQVVALLING